MASCNDFLEKEPAKSSAQRVETLDDLEAILNEPMTLHVTSSTVNFIVRIIRRLLRKCTRCINPRLP